MTENAFAELAKTNATFGGAYPALAENNAKFKSRRWIESVARRTLHEDGSGRTVLEVLGRDAESYDLSLASFRGIEKPR